MLPREPVPPSHAIEPDQFHLRDDSPLRHEHELLSSLYTSVIGKTGYPNPHLENLEAGRTFLELPPTDLGRVVLAAAERHVNALLTSVDLNQHAAWRSRLTAEGVGPKLLKRGFEVDREGTFDLLLYLSILPTHHRQGTEAVAGRLTAAAARYADESPLTEGERFVLSLYRNSLISGPPLGVDSDPVKFVSRLVNDGAEIFLVPGEVWTDGLNRDLAALDTSQREAWLGLLRHCLTATAARPSAKWLKTAAKLMQAVGGEQVRGAISRWFPQVAQGSSVRKIRSYSSDSRGGSDTMNEENANCLRGLLWCAPFTGARATHADDHGRGSLGLQESSRRRSAGGEGRQWGRLRVVATRHRPRRWATGHAQTAGEIRDRPERDRQGLRRTAADAGPAAR